MARGGEHIERLQRLSGDRHGVLCRAGELHRKLRGLRHCGVFIVRESGAEVLTPSLSSVEELTIG